MSVLRLAHFPAILMLSLLMTCGHASAQVHFLATNDDVGPPLAFTMSTVYNIAANGSLTLNTTIPSEGFGIGGGYFPENRIVSLNNTGNQCFFIAQSLDGDLVGVPVSDLQTFSRVYGSDTDLGSTNGIGLANNTQYVYASFTDDNAIGTFEIEGNCSLTFVGDTPVAGLNGGTIDAIHVLGNMMVATYGDGSIESFNLSSGMPVSNGDLQNSTGSKSGQNYPSAIDITQDGHFAVFGDTSTATIIEVSDISSGKLTPTVVYQLAPGTNSSNIMLSPDETLLYISNTQGDTITAAFFNSSSGQVTFGCKSGLLKNYVTDWTYVSGIALASTTGTGGTVYAAEFPASIAEVNVTSSGGACTLTEAAGSPVSDPNAGGLLSLTSFPPRAF